MERTRWTDERIDDALEAIRYGSARHDEEIRELRTETRAEFSQLRIEAGQFRAEVRAEFAEVRGEIAALRLMGLRIGGGLMVGFASVIATILLRAPA